MNNNQVYAGVLALVIISAGAYLYMDTGFQDQEVQEIENGTTATDKTQPLNFQGQKNDVKVTEEGLKLDTRTKVVKEEVTDGRSVIGAQDSEVYFTKEDGSVYSYDGSNTEQMEFNAMYGAVFGDFDYSGFNVVYGNENKEAYIRDLGTGEEKELFEDIVEVVKTDADSDGVSEAAEVRLRNGSTFTYEPVETQGRQDWDNDGMQERLYIKNTALYSYDSRNGEEKITDASSYAVREDTIYTAYEGKVRRLSFEQVLNKEGSYVSKPVEFDSNVEIAQLITDSSLNSGEVEATVVTPAGNESFKLRDGEADHKFSITSNRAKVKLEFVKGDKSPVVRSFKLLYR